MTPPLPRIEIVGAGRMGTALVSALEDARYDVSGPMPRGATGEHAEVVLLAVPDDSLVDAASHILPGRFVGHLSGATTLAPLAPHQRFSMHPLTTIVKGTVGKNADSPFVGVTAAVAGTNPTTVELAETLARALGMSTILVEDRDRAAYHAAASIASNFLITIEWVAEQLALTAGVSRDALLPLVSAAVRNWGEVGPEAALTGPIARGDASTVERQRAAIKERLPENLPLFDALAQATRDLAGRGRDPQSLDVSPENL